MDGKEIVDRFNLALLQYETMDKHKVEKFGSLIQGFVGIKEKENCRIIPFQLSKESDVEQLRKYLLTLQTDFVGVSFVQHYIHYT